jgi:hypothetical protein
MRNYIAGWREEVSKLLWIVFAGKVSTEARIQEEMQDKVMNSKNKKKLCQWRERSKIRWKRIEVNNWATPRLKTKRTWQLDQGKDARQDQRGWYLWPYQAKVQDRIARSIILDSL